MNICENSFAVTVDKKAEQHATTVGEVYQLLQHHMQWHEYFSSLEGVSFFVSFVENLIFLFVIFLLAMTLKGNLVDEKNTEEFRKMAR